MNRESNNPHLSEIIDRRYGRRSVLSAGVSLAVSGLLAATGEAEAGHRGGYGRHDHDRWKHHWHERHGRPGHGKSVRGSRLGFEPVPHSTEDTVVVPRGYSVQVLLPEGEPLTAGAPPYIPGDFNSGADRERQVGAHHDGMAYFPMFHGPAGNRHGLLCVNHENINLELIHLDGGTFESGNFRPIEDEVRKEIASHGVSIVEIRREWDGRWQVVRGRYNRRITAATPMEIAGPVRGTAFVRTRYSPKGTMTRGTLNNCANGQTPWGTYLTCEENWAGYFFNTGERPREQTRYGVPASAASTYGWGTRPEDQYARFDATPKANDATGDYRNEPNCFGWVVEIDPFDPRSVPKKRTALGRFAHEGAWLAPAKPGRPIVVYMGDDSRGEYVYKFVSRDPYRPGKTDGRILDHGTLYVARFNPDGTGVWIALEYGVNGLTEANGFTSQADVLVNARSAADHVGATPMDRPEWAAVDPRTGFVYLTLTNNSGRGISANQPVDAANPRARNPDGHILRWREAHDRHDATEFTWDIFLFGGATRERIVELGASDPVYAGDERYAAQVFPGTHRRRFLGDEASFNSPDGLWISPQGIVWIQTDGYSSASRGFGNQQMLAADPQSGDVRRFLTGPVGCEITGIAMTPDGRTMFVNVQHPEGSSTWPNINGETRPRSATVVITRDDGGVIGT